MEQRSRCAALLYRRAPAKAAAKHMPNRPTYDKALDATVASARGLRGRDGDLQGNEGDDSLRRRSCNCNCNILTAETQGQQRSQRKTAILVGQSFSSPTSTSFCCTQL